MRSRLRSSHNRIQYELTQLLDARLRPGKQVESAFEHFRLWRVRRVGIAILPGLACQQQFLELAVEPFAGTQLVVANGYRKCVSEFHGFGYPHRLSLPLALTKRISTNTRINGVDERTTEISCCTCAGNKAIEPGCGDQE